MRSTVEWFEPTRLHLEQHIMLSGDSLLQQPLTSHLSPLDAATLTCDSRTSSTMRPALVLLAFGLLVNASPQPAPQVATVTVTRTVTRDLQAATTEAPVVIPDQTQPTEVAPTDGSPTPQEPPSTPEATENTPHANDMPKTHDTPAPNPTDASEQPGPAETHQSTKPGSGTPASPATSSAKQPNHKTVYSTTVVDGVTTSHAVWRSNGTSSWVVTKTPKPTSLTPSLPPVANAVNTSTLGVINLSAVSSWLANPPNATTLLTSAISLPAASPVTPTNGFPTAPAPHSGAQYCLPSYLAFVLGGIGLAAVFRL